MTRSSGTTKSNNASYDASATWLNAHVADYVSQSDINAQALASDLNFAATKRPKADLFYYNPASAPANTEGHIYYSSVDDQLKVRSANAWTGASGFHHQAKYTVFKEGSNYKVIDSDGAVQYCSTSYEVAMNDEAYAGISGADGSLDIVYSKGAMTVDDTVLMPSNSHTIISGSCVADAALDKPMFKNSTPATNNYNVVLEGDGYAVLNGNGANQANALATGVEFKTATNITDLFANSYIHQYGFTMRNILVQNCYSYCIDFDGDTGHAGAASNTRILMDNVSAWNVVNEAVPAFKMQRCPDSKIIGGCFDGNTGTATFAIELESMAAVEFHPHYVNGPNWLHLVRNMDMTVGLSDLGSNEDQWLFDGVWDSTVSGLFLVHGNGDANTWDAIKLDDASGTDCTNIVFSKCQFRRAYDASGTRTFKYGIEQTDVDQGPIRCSGIDGADCATAWGRLLNVASQSLHDPSCGTPAEV